MPRVLCIDEIRFSEEINQKFVCVLTDFEKGEIVDIIKNRQMAYLREYFGSINPNELNIVKVFISDMYDAYESVRSRYFERAVHVVDLFHVIAQLTNAVNRLRTKAMNTKAKKGGLAYNFMKAHWKYFICRSSKVPDKFYTYAKTGEVFHYDDLILECLKLDSDLWSGYAILQELFSYANHYYSFEEAVNFINRLVSRLYATTSDILKTVAKTYHRWRNEIANGLAKGQRQMKYTNVIAESLNNQLKTIIKSAYGYHNFERFRKRAMLIMTYGKSPYKKGTKLLSYPLHV
jgi:transposase